MHGMHCRGLFATHYHRLADAHEQDPRIAICHMGCSVQPGNDGGPEQVTGLAWAFTSPPFAGMDCLYHVLESADLQSVW